MPRHDNSAVRQALMVFVRDYQLEHGYPPTPVEIAPAIGRTRQAVYGHLQALADEGLLKLGQRHAILAVPDPTEVE